MTVTLPTFTLYHVPTTTSYTIVDDRMFGGVEVNYASSGKQSIFQVVLDANSGFPFGKDNITDEIEIRLETPTDTAGPGTIYRGIIIELQPIVRKKGRWLRIKGVNWGDYWLYGRKFDHDYKANPQPASQILNDIIAATHPDMVILDPVTMKILLESLTLGDLVFHKTFEGGYAGKALQEVCASLDLEYSVTAEKLVRLTPIRTNYFPVDETKLVAAPELTYSGDGFKIDTVVVNSVLPMTAPNHTTPTGDALCSDKKYWEPRGLEVDGTTPTSEKLLSFRHDGQFIGGCMAGIGLGFNIGGTTGVALTCKPGTAQLEDGTILGWTGFALDAEAPDGVAVWDRMKFGFLNNFNLSKFYIRLNQGENGSGGYWITTNNAVEQATRGVNVPWDLRLPNNPDVDPSLWTKVGQPTQIDEIQFCMTGSESLSIMQAGQLNPSMISYLHFDKTLKSAATITSPPTVPRQLLITDRTLDDQDDIDSLAASELARVKDAALVGTIEMMGREIYAGSSVNNPNKLSVNPGDGAALDLAYHGFDTETARVDHIAMQAVNNYWVATLALGPFLTSDTFTAYHSLMDLLFPKEDNESDE